MLKFTPLIVIGAIALLSGCVTTPLAQSDTQTTQTGVSTAPLSYNDYELVLSTYVNADGLVDYSTLQANPQPLEAFVTQLGDVSPESYAAWSETDKIAFLINAYNALTLQSIIDQNPLKASIKDIFGVWNFNKHRVVGQSITLDTIEHEMLRKEFSEPRIHAALVCAAISCPPLRREAYTGERLNEQLEEQVNQWLSGPHGIQIDRAQNQVAISSIFDWFGQDWQAQYGVEGGFTGNDKERAVLNFISNYVSLEDRQYLSEGNYDLKYLNYDWSLNRQ